VIVVALDRERLPPIGFDFKNPNPQCGVSRNNYLKSSAAELHRKIDQIGLNGIVNTARLAATYRLRNSRKMPAPNLWRRLQRLSEIALLMPLRPVWK